MPKSTAYAVYAVELAVDAVRLMLSDMSPIEARVFWREIDKLREENKPSRHGSHADCKVCGVTAGKPCLDQDGDVRRSNHTLRGK